MKKSSQLLVSGIVWLINVPRNEPVLGRIKTCLIAPSKFVLVFSIHVQPCRQGFLVFQSVIAIL